MAEQRKQLGGGGELKRMPSFLAVNLVTPTGVVAHQETDAITAPGELGELEVLPGHVALLTGLKPGVLTIGEKQRVRYAVSDGYLRVDSANAVEILVEKAMPSSEVDIDAARADLKTAEAELAKWGDKPMDAEHRILVHAVEWARARIAAAGSN
jgi:F-type H+-transporting ATPase subunit epsilon